MAKLTVIIPARNELYLAQTVEDLLRKAAGEIEIIVILDGWWPKFLLPEDKRVIVIHRERRGMRAAINSAVAIARGEYLMKMDAHCALAEGFDEVLKADCADNWVVIPRRYSLQLEAWSAKPDRPFVDYEYLGWPYDSDHNVHGSKLGLHARTWNQRIAERIDRLVDENMSFQGSCWFTSKQHFLKRIGPLQEEGYGTFIGEPQEIGLKTWLGEGQIMTNKKTWYAHLWKGKPYREAHMKELGFAYTRVGASELKKGNEFSVNYWMGNCWKDRKHDLAWLVDRFWPVPSWPPEREQWIRFPTS